VGALAPFSFLVQVEQYISIEWNTDSYIATLKRQTEHFKNENDVIVKLVYFFNLSGGVQKYLFCTIKQTLFLLIDFSGILNCYTFLVVPFIIKDN